MIIKVKQDLICNKHVQVDIIHNPHPLVEAFLGITITLSKMVIVQVKLKMDGHQLLTKIGLIQEVIIQLSTKMLQPTEETLYQKVIQINTNLMVEIIKMVIPFLKQKDKNHLLIQLQMVMYLVMVQYKVVVILILTVKKL